MPKILIAYVVVSQGRITADYVSRFVGSYLTCPPGITHETVIVCNGGPLPRDVALLFDSIPCSFLPRINDPGWDVSGYQDVAKQIPCDMLVCFGESVYFHRTGWLEKLADAWTKHGPGMYGLFSSFLVRAHLNTTAFVCFPDHLKRYPRATSHGDRYAFEHGEHAFWRFVQSLGAPVKLVTWDGVWDSFQWRMPNNILWRGTQTNCLAYCSHTDHYFGADATTRARWQQWIDQPFK